MAYTICDTWGKPKPLRMVMTDSQNRPYVGQPFTPHWWVCDPCNKSSERFEITYREGQEHPNCYHWYEVILPDDTEQDVAAKMKHYAEVIAARDAFDVARRKYEQLAGVR